MRTTFSPNVDTVEVPNAMPMLRARTAPPDEGLCSDSTPTWHPYQYPPTISARNTFLAFPGRDPSLEEFFEERRAHSCPAKFREDSREEEEVPLASSRTTACGSASTGSWDTPPQTPPLELSDAEDMSELTERVLRVAPNASAAPLPASCMFRKTVSDYRRSEDSQPAIDQEAPDRALGPGADMMQRQALPPGPIQGTLRPQMTSNGEPVGYYQESYHDGYDNDYSNGSCDNGFSNGYIGSYDEGFNAGYQTAISGYIRMPAGPGQEDIGQQMVPQMSSLGHPGMHLPPPPGTPAPSPSPLPHPPAAPSQEPLQQVAPTRGSMGHGFSRCKPCAFVHTKGCGNGFECPFCHLCEPGEKKKRRKDKQEFRRASRDIRHAFPFGTSFPISTSIPIGHGFFS